MIILNFLAIALIVLTAVYFILLGIVALLKPTMAARFLLGFANSAAMHYLELFLRMAIGFALIHQSTNMLFADVYWSFGWLLVATTACLFLLPWQWHRKFTNKVVPYANTYLALIGITSLVLGMLILGSIFIPAIQAV